MGDVGSDAWFSGFTDGEGCFELAGAPKGRVQPQFSINLRADAGQILLDLQARFGGRIHYRPARNNGAPQHDWVVKRKRELGPLVDYFDRFSLRAKKAGDYALWRRAVQIYLESDSNDPRLKVLRKSLMAGRAYDASVKDLVIPEAWQLTLEDA